MTEGDNKLIERAPTVLIGCQALEHVLAPLAERCVTREFKKIALHLHPDRLREELNETVSRLEGEGVTIILGYGLCGRALQGVVSQKSRLVLPRVDDCVGGLLGSRERHRQVLNENPGTFFLTEHWLDTELNAFRQLLLETQNLPKEQQRRILRAGLRHYRALGLLDSESRSKQAQARIEQLAVEHKLGTLDFEPDLGLLTRLVWGPWRASEFIITEPGEPIPFF